MLAIERHHLFVHALARLGILLALVLGLERLHLRLEELHSTRRADLLDEERHDEQPHHDRQTDDGQYPGNPRPVGESDEDQGLVDRDHAPGHSHLEGP